MEPMQRSEGHASGSVMALSDLGEEMKDGEASDTGILCSSLI